YAQDVGDRPDAGHHQDDKGPRLRAAGFGGMHHKRDVQEHEDQNQRHRRPDTAIRGQPGGRPGAPFISIVVGSPVGVQSAVQAAYAQCATRPANSPRPSVQPTDDSTWFSGCGIRPSTLSFSLSTPAMELSAPFTFDFGSRLPSPSV